MLIVVPNYECDFCGKPIYVKPSRIKRSKRICCSKKCDNDFRKIWFKGDNNHQYGLKGDKNKTYNKDDIMYKNGYIFVRVINHPFSDNKGWVREHRIVAEKYLLTDENSIEIDGELFLSPKFEVHHKDEDKHNNVPENLEILSKSEHRKLHNKSKPQKKKDSKTGKFI